MVLQLDDLDRTVRGEAGERVISVFQARIGVHELEARQRWEISFSSMAPDASRDAQTGCGKEVFDKAERLDCERRIFEEVSKSVDGSLTTQFWAKDGEDVFVACGTDSVNGVGREILRRRTKGLRRVEVSKIFNTRGASWIENDVLKKARLRSGTECVRNEGCGFQIRIQIEEIHNVITQFFCATTAPGGFSGTWRSEERREKKHE
ncbi:hypothetical protein C8R44DRAFT_923938 [Mycena epipterygia]|nr:hypothetical protein C8R44DRAFT_923938 [Mycena epipterygia]